MRYSDIKFDCKYFKGDIPCLPNKLRNKVCKNCDEYIRITKKILIIKLGAIGDVIRTTPLLRRLRKEFPDCHITWITNTPDVVPLSFVDCVYEFDFKSVFIVKHLKYDMVINLDKDAEACALSEDLNATVKYGFILKNGQINLADKNAELKLLTGIYDNISKQNKKNYMQEIFEICGFEFKDEKYILDIEPKFQKDWNLLKKNAAGRKIIGLNTGCGKRWLTRLWPEEYWLSLIDLLQKNNFYPLLLGGPDEEIQNRKYAQITNAHYPGIFPLKKFISLSSQCDLIISAVSMMMHIAIGLGKPLILFNNIFNIYEFYLYNNGIILQPTSGCDCFYGNSCKRERSCMNDISVEMVYQAILNLIKID